MFTAKEARTVSNTKIEEKIGREETRASLVMRDLSFGLKEAARKGKVFFEYILWDYFSGAEEQDLILALGKEADNLGYKHEIWYDDTDCKVGRKTAIIIQLDWSSAPNFSKVARR